MAIPDRNERRSERERLKRDLVRIGKFVTFGVDAERRTRGWSDRELANELLGNLKSARSTYKDYRWRRIELNSVPSRHVARAIVQAYGLPRHHEERIRKQVERLGPNILSELEKYLTKQ